MLKKREVVDNFSFEPFLKWAGGKRWLIKKYSEIFPKKYNRYIEPFLGSGAVFFYLSPQDAVLGDLNEELINTYISIKKDWEKVCEELVKHQEHHSPTYYYNIRNAKYRAEYKRAARIIYLNRTCWNGLYRVNKEGKFNVPIGTKNKVILNSDNFEEMSLFFQKTRFLCSDFENLIDEAQQNDFLFVDPPYTVSHNNNGFIKYNEKIFSWKDQQRLKKSLVRAKERGAIIISTNAFHDSIFELYNKDFDVVEISRASVIAGKASARKKYSELLIMANNMEE